MDWRRCFFEVDDVKWVRVYGISWFEDWEVVERWERKDILDKGLVYVKGEYDIFVEWLEFGEVGTCSWGILRLMGVWWGVVVGE